MVNKKQNLERIASDSNITGFDKIRLEIERPDLIGSYAKDIRTLYLLGRKGKVLVSATAVKNGNGRYYNFVGSDKRKPIEWELSGGYVWGCLEGREQRDRYPKVDINGTSFTTTPTLDYYPLIFTSLTVDLGYKYEGRIKDFRPLNQREFSIIGRLQNEHKRLMQKRRDSKKRNPRPSIGDQVYIPTSLYLSHGADDFLGGLCTISNVWEEHGNVWISLEEKAGGHNWSEYLAEKQTEWQEEYGEQRGRPDPDLRPQFNRWD